MLCNYDNVHSNEYENSGNAGVFLFEICNWSEFSIIHTRLAGRAHFAPLLVFKLWKNNKFARYDKNSLYSLVNKIIQYKRNGNWLLSKMCFDKNNPAIHVCVNQILKDVKKKLKNIDWEIVIFTRIPRSQVSYFRRCQFRVPAHSRHTLGSNWTKRFPCLHFWSH